MKTTVQFAAYRVAANGTLAALIGVYATRAEAAAAARAAPLGEGESTRVQAGISALIVESGEEAEALADECDARAAEAPADSPNAEDLEAATEYLGAIEAFPHTVSAPSEVESLIIEAATDLGMIASPDGLTFEAITAPAFQRFLYDAANGSQSKRLAREALVAAFNALWREGGDPESLWVIGGMLAQRGVIEGYASGAAREALTAASEALTPPNSGEEAEALASVSAALEACDESPAFGARDDFLTSVADVVMRG
jgi:hypothetical protein